MGRALPLIGRLALTGASAAVCFAAASPLAQAHEHGKPLTKARFLHAVPMAAPATLIVHGHPPRIASSYGKPSEYHACHPGPARVELKLRGQRKPAATANLDIGRGRYTVIAVPDRGKVGLRVYKDGTATPGKARMRTINAAAELARGGHARGRAAGPPDRFRSRPPATRRCRPAATTCRSPHRVASSTRSCRLSACRWRRGAPPRQSSSAPAARQREVLLVSDQTAGPSVAPATGFVDDIGSGSGWLLVLLAALAAGWLGGTTYLLSARRRTGATLPATGVMAAPQVPRARLRPPTDATPSDTRPGSAASPPGAPPPTSAPPIRRQSRVEPAPDRSWALAAAAALTAGSLGRLLYKAGRRRRGA